MFIMIMMAVRRKGRWSWSIVMLLVMKLMEKRRTLMMITLTIVVTTRTRWTVIVSSWQRKYVTGKEEEDGYPSQEMVIYGSSRSSPRSHSAVGGNFDPQVTNTVSASSHHITSPHLIDKICHKNLQNGERFSRKVFVGGLPPDIDEGIFSQYFILDLNLWNSVYICVVKYQIPIIQMRSRLPSVVLDPWLWTGHIRLPEIYISLFFWDMDFMVHGCYCFSNLFHPFFHHRLKARAISLRKATRFFSSRYYIQHKSIQNC